MSKKNVAYGQVVIGPPGSGKTTYCTGMKEFLTGIGRKVAVVNMDPANDQLPYSCSLDISDLVTLGEVMDCLKLGPNGGLIYCMEFIEKNLDWFGAKLQELKDAGYYFLFDCPGQVELYTHHDSVKKIFKFLEKNDFRLVAVHLVDSHYCSDPAKFISVLLTSLSTMLQVELPHVNVLSKMDLIQQYGKLPFNLEFFTDVLDMSYLVEMFEKDPFMKRFKKLNKALTNVIQDYGLVSFTTLCIEDKETMIKLIQLIDKAGGYVFGIKDQNNMASMLSCAAGADFECFTYLFITTQNAIGSQMGGYKVYLFVVLLAISSAHLVKGRTIKRPQSSDACAQDGNTYRNGQVLSVSACAVIFCAEGEIKRIPLVDEQFGCPHVEMVRKDGKCVNEAGDEIEHDVVISYTDCAVDTCVYGGVKRLKSLYCEPGRTLLDTSKVSEKWPLINGEV
eukprot:gene159-771_t